MAIHILESTQTVSASLEECWNFFSNPANLAAITPPSLGFEVRTRVPEKIHPGLMIEYRVRPLLGIPLTWLTEITHVDPRRYFVDEQRSGPYAIWHHEHFFSALPDGRVEMRDLVHYRLPFSPLSEVVHPFLVRPQLRKIFSHRRLKVEELFPP